MNIKELATDYKKYGFTPLPLSPLSKAPLGGSNLDTIDTMPFETQSNIGLYPGSPNNLVVVDADNEKSQAIVTNSLQGMGLYNQTTIVRTPKKLGLHFWLRVPDVPDWVQSFYTLPDDIGGGEFRLHRKAYVVAPGSTLREGKYNFVQGGMECFTGQPVVEWKDLAWLLPSTYLGEKFFGSNVLKLPVRLNYRPNPKCIYFLRTLKNAPKSNPVNKIDLITGEILKDCYDSRSEAEAAVVTSLILSGWTFEEIEKKFNDVKPGHYIEHANRQMYLISTYNNVIRYLTRSVSQYKIANAYQNACLIGWPGRGGEYEQRVLLGILAKAWQFDTYIPSVSQREICEHASISRRATVIDTVKRLSKQGFIKKLTTDTYETSRYDLSEFIYSVNNRTITQAPNTPPVSNGTVIDNSPWETAELWSRNMLGGTVKLILPHLDKKTPISEKILVELTRKAPNTLKNALRNKMLPYGLARPFAGGWIRGERNLEELAKELGAKEKAEYRQQQHEKERADFEERITIKRIVNKVSDGENQE
jgi:hypothetical protein